MTRGFRWVTAAVLALAVVAGSAGAQEYFPTPTIAVRGGYSFSEESVTAGLSSSVPLDGRLEIVFGGDLVLDPTEERWRLSADIQFRIGRAGEYYLGAGPALVDFEQEELVGRTKFGYTIVAGREFRRADAVTFRPTIEPRLTVVGRETMFHVAIGIVYALETPF
jgi:hypothetical protein